MAKLSTQGTARLAKRVLVSKGIGFQIPTAKQKKNLLVEYVKRNMVIYGKAFDMIKTKGKIDLNSPTSVASNLDKITVYEIKSTRLSKVGSNFKGYFFALTTAELLAAQSLKGRFRFAFVNTSTGNFQDWSLAQIFAKAKGIYPTWSIMI
jgi:hypothetical protein